jgi:VCBS repeat-containing protein
VADTIPSISLKAGVTVQLGQTYSFSDLFVVDPGTVETFAIAIRFNQLAGETYSDALDYWGSADYVYSGNPQQGLGGTTWADYGSGTVTFTSTTAISVYVQYISPTDAYPNGYVYSNGESFSIPIATAPSLSVAANAPTVYETPTGTEQAIFTVSLSAASQDTISVHYATQDGTAKAGTDYEGNSGTITFAPGQTTATISVPIIGTELTQHNETFTLNLSNPTDSNGATPSITNNGATGTIDALFTKGAETVNFNSLTGKQPAAVDGGADLYNALGGGDTITLPNANPTDTSVALAGSDKTFDLQHTFAVGDSPTGVTANVYGGSGSYNIALGAGSEAVTINGTGTTKVAAGSGTDSFSISGGGTLIVDGNLSGGSASIGANSTLELRGTDSGTITFSGANATLKIDGTMMPTGAISGFAPGDTIVLANIDFASLPSDVFIEGPNLLSILPTGSGPNVSLNLKGNFLDARVTQDPSKGIDIKDVSVQVDNASAVKNFADAVDKITNGVAAVLAKTPASFEAFQKVFDPFFTSLGALSEANLIYQKAQQTFSNPDATPEQIRDTWSEATTEVLDLTAKTLVAGLLTAGAIVIGAGVAVAAVEGSVLGAFLLAIGVAIESLPVPVIFGTAVAGTLAYDSYWDAYIKQPLDQWIGQKIIPSINEVLHLQDGYISGATVFADANGTGQLAVNDVSTTTDSTGGFSLIGGSGPLIAFGGTDISTGLPFKGQLSAPEGSSVITPLTTILTNLASDPSAQQKVLSNLGLSSTLNLATFDPIAAAQSGNADGAATEIAGAKVYDTVEMIAAALAGVGATFTPSLQAAFFSLASALDGSGINLSDKTALSGLITQVAQIESVSLGEGVADAMATIIAAGNAALDHVLQTDLPGAQLLSDAAGVELVEQGAVSTALTNAAGNSSQLQSLTNLFTGTNLNTLITQAQNETQNPGQDLGPVAFNGTSATDQNTVLKGSVSAIDLEGNSIAYTLDGSAPVGLTFNSDGTFSFDPGSNYKYLALGESATLSFKFTASDGHGTARTGTETITINGLNDPPTIDGTSTTATGTINELPHTTGSNAIDKASGVIAFSDPDLGDRPTATIDTRDETFSYQDSTGHTYALTPAQIATFEGAISIQPETGNTNAGKIDWVFNFADKQIDFLGAGETVTATIPVVIDDHHGGTVTKDVVVTIDGANDSPVAAPDSNGVAWGRALTVAANKGVLANDSDPDMHDTLTVEAVDGKTKAVGHAIEGKYGWLTLDADGSYTYTASHDNDGFGWDHRGWDNRSWDDRGWDDRGGIKQDTFTYTVSDGHGGLTTSTLNIVVFEKGTTYLSGANTTLTAAHNGPYVLDGSAGDDTLKAGHGDAVLIGGTGDTLIAGRGDDTFLFRPNFGTNTIKNFDVHEDTLDFDQGIFKNVHDILAHTTNTAAGAVISDGHGDTVTLLGVTTAQLHNHEHDFHLV